MDVGVAFLLTLYSQAYTLETIHADALNKLQELRDAGKLSSADYDMITEDSKSEDVLSFMNDAILRHASSRSIKNKKVHENVKPLLDSVDRFGSVIDILASSSPQVHGVNPARLVWGAIKFVVLVSTLPGVRGWEVADDTHRSRVILLIRSMLS